MEAKTGSPTPWKSGLRVRESASIGALAVSASLLSLVACDESAFERPSPIAPGSATAIVTPPPLPSRPFEGRTSRVVAPKGVRLTGFRVDAAPGDLVIERGDRVAVISATNGRLVDFGLAGGPDAMVGFEPTLYTGLDRARLALARVEPLADGSGVHVEKRVLDPEGLTLDIFYGFEPGGSPVLRVESVVRGGAKGAIAVTLGEIARWGNTPSWMPGVGFVTQGGTFTGDQIARISKGIAYAMCSEQGRLVARFDSEEAPGFHEPAFTGEAVVPVPVNGLSARRVIQVVATGGSIGATSSALHCGGATKTQSIVGPSAAPADAEIEVARCPDPALGDKPDAKAGAPFTRFFPSDSPLSIPEGCLVARLVAPGHAPGAWVSPAELATNKSALPTAGRLRFRVTEKGKGLLPAKLFVRGDGDTRAPSLGEDGDTGPAVDSVYSLGEGEIALPKGKYKIAALHGFEYTAVESSVAIEVDKMTTFEAELERVVDTTGFLSADLHVHAEPSPDAPTPLAQRARSLAAVGVEAFAATDHNAITDYRKTIADLGLTGKLVSIVGDEVTSQKVFWGHFNAFPLAPDAALPKFEDVTPKELIESARRAAAPGVESVVQLNHPRMGGIGYFELARLDPSDVKGSLARSPLLDLGFDAIEVWNGDHYDAIPKVERAMRDWYALLDAGFRDTATGNSDSHKAGYHECGVPRNWVQMDDDDPAHFDEHAFVAAIKKQRVVVSSGPFLRVFANGGGVGSTTRPGSVDFAIHVEAPPWIDVDRIELVRRGQVVKTIKEGFKSGVVRFDGKLSIDAAKGDWFIVIARGTKAIPYLHRRGGTPFAFTNPFFVDY